MNCNTTFAMTHFMKLYYDVFILEKIVSKCVISHWKLH
jgi:hypothetical protein